jgi:concanavalin A-like lectin/glucanase superfamily protein
MDRLVALASSAFPGVYLRIDGTGLTSFAPGGGGSINCQFGVGAWEKFRLEPQQDGSVALASDAFPGVYLRMDGTGVTSFADNGGGSINCQFGVGAWEKFRLEPQDEGTVALASDAFPGVYLRIDGTGVTSFADNGGGSVDCQFGVGPWEKFRLESAQSGLVFNGAGAYAEIPDSPEFSVSTTGSLTVAAWMRPDTISFPRTEGSGYVHWLGKGSPGNQEWTFRMYSQPNAENRANRISFYLFNPHGGLGIGSHFQEPVTPGEWIHVAAVVTDDRIFIYKNGSVRDCDQYRGLGDQTCNNYDESLWITPHNGTAPLRMGTRDLRSFFQGTIGPVQIWNRALAAAEVAALHESGLIPEDALVANYQFQEGHGDTAHDSAGGHDAHLFGATWLGSQ